MSGWKQENIECINTFFPELKFVGKKGFYGARLEGRRRVATPGPLREPLLPAALPLLEVAGSVDTV